MKNNAIKDARAIAPADEIKFGRMLKYRK